MRNACSYQILQDDRKHIQKTMRISRKRESQAACWLGTWETRLSNCQESENTALLEKRRVRDQAKCTVKIEINGISLTLIAEQMGNKIKISYGSGGSMKLRRRPSGEVDFLATLG
jgi:hypothetical protein